MGKSCHPVAALATNNIAVLPMAHLRVQLGLCWNTLLARQEVPPAPFLWAGRQQMHEKALAGCQKQGLFTLFKGKRRGKLSKASPQAGWMKSAVNNNKSVQFLVPNFNNVMRISGKETKRQAITDTLSSLSYTHNPTPRSSVVVKLL